MHCVSKQVISPVVVVAVVEVVGIRWEKHWSDIHQLSVMAGFLPSLLVYAIFGLTCTGALVYHIFNIQTPDEGRFGWKWQFLTFINMVCDRRDHRMSHLYVFCMNSLSMISPGSVSGHGPSEMVFYIVQSFACHVHDHWAQVLLCPCKTDIQSTIKHICTPLNRFCGVQ